MDSSIMEISIPTRTKTTRGFMEVYPHEFCWKFTPHVSRTCECHTSLASGTMLIPFAFFSFYLHRTRICCMYVVQVRTNGLIGTTTHPWAPLPLRQPRPAAEFATAPYRLRRHAPLLGEHTREVLAEAGASPQDIDALIATGVATHTRGKAIAEQHGRDPRLRTLMSA
eukprot:m.1157460 g.1157460  ORF g.1157460 m.1157460 type:complete len:168 (+) comp24495_c0_seq23:1504-2007(+)